MLRLACLLSILATSAYASQCGPHEAIRDALRAKYGEGRVMAGLSSAGTLLEVYVAADGSTWTVLEANAQGLACVRSAGQHMRVFPAGQAS